MNIEQDQARRLRELARQFRASHDPTPRATLVVLVAGGYPRVGVTTIVARLAAELSRLSLNVELQPVDAMRDDQHVDADIALIDAGVGYSRRAAAIWNQADLALLVATDAPEVVLETYAALKLAKAQHPALPVWLLPNQCTDQLVAEVLCRRISESCERFLGTAIPAAPWLPLWNTEAEPTDGSVDVAKLARFLRESMLSSRSLELVKHAA
ncbi:MAG: hypothetical protein WD851_00225 [Pirellulales bacterium]